GHGRARRLAAAGAHRLRAELAQPLGRDLVALDDGLELRGAGAEADRHALDGAALADRREVAADLDVADPPPRVDRTVPGGQRAPAVWSVVAPAPKPTAMRPTALPSRIDAK